MDFFERQEQAHRNTRLLLIYFVLGVIALIAAVYLVSLLIFTGFSLYPHQGYLTGAPLRPSFWNPKLFFCVSAGTLAIVTIGSGFKSMELAKGGTAVATMLGGRLISPATTDPNERKVLNVVEEMAIAAGVPVPQVYLMDEENGINA